MLFVRLFLIPALIFEMRLWSHNIKIQMTMTTIHGIKNTIDTSINFIILNETFFGCPSETKSDSRGLLPPKTRRVDRRIASHRHGLRRLRPWAPRRRGEDPA